MSDYISREAAIETIRVAGCTDCGGSSGTICGFCDFDNNGILMIPYHSCKCSLDNSPTVDAVPVVRCRDCKHMCRNNVGVFCKVWNGYNGCGYDGFCNYGEQREPK